MNQQANTPKYFDLHTSGIGYLRRVREVNPTGTKGRSKAKPFLACSISAFYGEAGDQDSINYTYFDVKVVGEKAKEVVRDLQEAANDKNRKVIIVFKLGDLYVDTFTYTQGDRAGQTGFQLKGRLLQIKMAKVDGETVYVASDEAEEGANTDQQDGQERTGTEG